MRTTPVAAWLSYSLVVQQAPALSNDPGAQKRGEGALQQMAALAQRLRQQVSGHRPLRSPALSPSSGSHLRTGPLLLPHLLQKTGSSPPLSSPSWLLVSLSVPPPSVSFEPLEVRGGVFSLSPSAEHRAQQHCGCLPGLFVEIK